MTTTKSSASTSLRYSSGIEEPIILTWRTAYRKYAVSHCGGSLCVSIASVNNQTVDQVLIYLFRDGRTDNRALTMDVNGRNIPRVTSPLWRVDLIRRSANWRAAWSANTQLSRCVRRPALFASQQVDRRLAAQDAEVIIAGSQRARRNWSAAFWRHSAERELSSRLAARRRGSGYRCRP